MAESSIKPQRFMGKKIVYINSNKMRSSSGKNIEFCIYGLHEDFPEAIAKDEIFIDDSLKPSELPKIFKGIRTRIDCRLKGKSKDHSYKSSMHREKKFRSDSMKKVSRLRTYTSLSDRRGIINVYVVSGEVVRDKYKTDFSQGGHGYVYDWIPKDEIWLEEEESDEFPAILGHEYFEMMMMRELGMSYEDAHEEASKIEKMLRDNRFSKSDFGIMLKAGQLLLSPD